MIPCTFIKRRLLPPKPLLLLYFVCISIFAQAQVAIEPIDSNCDEFQISAQITNPRCPGANNGRIQIIAVNDDGTPLQFQWLNLSATNNTNVANNLIEGDYEVIVFSETCEDTLSFSLIDPLEINAPALDTTLCGENTINILQGVNGGTGNYTINIETIVGPSQNCVNCDNTILNFSAFTILLVEISDENDCSVTRSVVVDVAPPLTASAEIIQNETCDDNGVVELFASGGSNTYLYRIINASDPTTEGNYQTSNVFENLEGNTTYVFQVYDPVAACRTNVEVMISVIANNVTVNPTASNISCFGAQDGVINIGTTNTEEVMGYSLNNSDSNSDAVQVEPEFSNLGAGEYVVYVFNNDGACQESLVTINEPEILNLSTATEDATCDDSENGLVEFLVDGGNTGFQFGLSDDPNIAADQNILFDATIVDTLNPGTYYAYVVDVNGCEDEAFFTIDAPDAPDVNTITIPTCPGENTGSIVVVESGKLLYGVYEFSIDSMTWQQDTIFSDLAAGTYTLYLRNSNDCVFDDYAELVVVEVEAPNLTLTITPPSCPEGADASILIEQNIDTNSEGLQFSLDGEEFFSVNTFPNLTAGNYILYTRDEYGCVFEFPFEIENTEEPEVNLITNDVNCYGQSNGSIAIDVSEGNPPFEFALNGSNFQMENTFENLEAEDYVILVRDLNGCLFANNASLSEPNEIIANLSVVDETCSDKNGVISTAPTGGTLPYQLEWSTGDTSYLISHLISGQYSLLITDAQGCEQEENAFLEDQAGPTIVGEPSNVHCFGASSGAIDLNIINGIMPFEFYWSHGATSEDVSGLAAGNYSVTVIDNNQCESRKIYTIFEPSAIDLEYESGQAGEEWYINLSVTGGMPPYSYEWSNGEDTQDIFNLIPGEYTVVVTDDQNCSVERSIEVGLTDLGEEVSYPSLSLYPNPTSSLVRLETDFPSPKKTSYELRSLNGTLLQSGFLEGPITQFNVESYPSGVYILKTDFMGQPIFRKLIVAR